VVVVVVVIVITRAGFAWVVSVVVSMGVAFGMMVVVITGLAMGMVVDAESDFPIAMDEIESTDEEHADARNQRVDPEARIEMALHSPRHIEVEEDSSPGQEGENGQNLKKFFHGSERSEIKGESRDN